MGLYKKETIMKKLLLITILALGANQAMGVFSPPKGSQIAGYMSCPKGYHADPEEGCVLGTLQYQYQYQDIVSPQPIVLALPANGVCPSGYQAQYFEGTFTEDGVQITPTTKACALAVNF